jgi:hypothetical protein
VAWWIDTAGSAGFAAWVDWQGVEENRRESMCGPVRLVARNGYYACSRRQMARGDLDKLLRASQEEVCRAIADGRFGGKEPTAAMLARHSSTEIDGTNGKRPATHRAFLDDIA